jgi:cytoskeletal protein CcmA (bactofilin family)
VFKKDGIFGRNDADARTDPRPLNVNVMPDLRNSASPRQQPPAQVDALQLERSFSEPKPVARKEDRREESAGSKLIVGPDIKLKGVEITDCDTLVVEGRVEASMDSRVVQIAASGVFTGNATMDVAEIWGCFEGQLTVRKQLVIYASGRVSGQIRYGQIRIEEGGELSGEISTLAAHEGGSRRTEAAAPPSRESKVPAYDPVARPSAPPPVKSGAAAR